MNTGKVDSSGSVRSETGGASAGGGREHPADLLDRFVRQEVEKMVARAIKDGNGLAALGLATSRTDP